MSKEKYLRVTMPNGSKWDIPATIIAEDRARYYAEKDTGKDSGEEFNKVFNEEVDYALEYAYEIIDWASNNMNWVDVKLFAEKVEDMKMDYQVGRINGDKEVIEK